VKKKAGDNRTTRGTESFSAKVLTSEQARAGKGGGKNMPGTAKWGEVTLKRGTTSE
jgi:hypothetical protein